MTKRPEREIGSDFLLAVQHRLEVVLRSLSEVLIDLNRAERGVIWMSCSQSGLEGLRKVERMVEHARRGYNESQIPLFKTVLLKGPEVGEVEEGS
mgnify:CR=1 FL=1